MTDFVEGRADAAREQILHAAARQFAVLPYSQVNLDDIVTMADVTKGVLHAHFRSKLALASALVEYHLDVSWDVGATRIALGLGGLEMQIDYAYLIAAADIDHYLTRRLQRCRRKGSNLRRHRQARRRRRRHSTGLRYGTHRPSADLPVPRGTTDE